MSETLTTREYLIQNPARLQAVARALQQMYSQTRFYERLLAKKIKSQAITPEFVTDRFFDLPFSSKEDVVRNYPDGFRAAERGDVVLSCESSGTTGDTVGSTRAVSFFTKKDLERDSLRRFSPDLELTKQDVVAIALPYALTSSALGFHRAAQERGVCVIPLDAGSMLSSPQKHLDIIQGLGVTVLVSSMPLMYSTMVQSQGISPGTFFEKVRAVQLCGLPTLANGMKKTTERLAAQTFNTYGMSEFGALSFTCKAGNMHVHEEDFFIETIDPRTGETVDDVARGGEVVVTTLTREGSPKLRYRTGDFGHLDLSGTCSCGRTGAVLRVRGRMRDAVQLGERFWLPVDFEEVILSHPATTGMYKLRYEPKDEEGAVQITAVVDVEDPGDNGVSDAIVKQLSSVIHDGIRVELRRCGNTHQDLLDMKRYAAVRSTKSVTLEDGRPEEWLVSY